MKKILFIEDDPDQIFIYNTKFEMEGLLMMVAENGAQAKKLVLEKPDMILLDLLLREENGLDILAEIRKNPELKDIPVVVFTNMNKQEYRQRAKELGALDFIIKADTTPGEIVKRIKEILGA